MRINRLALWIIPVFLVWKLTQASILLPIATGISNLALQSAYSVLDPHIVYSEDKWQVTTRLFVASRPWPENTFIPQPKLSGYSSIFLGNLTGITLGLPLFWLFVLSRAGNSLKYLLFGSILVLLTASLAIFFKSAFQITQTLETDQILRVLTAGGYIRVPPHPPEWLASLLKPLRDVSAMCAIVVVPLLLVFVESSD